MGNTKSEPAGQTLTDNRMVWYGLGYRCVVGIQIMDKVIPVPIYPRVDYLYQGGEQWSLKENYEIQPNHVRVGKAYYNVTNQSFRLVEYDVTALPSRMFQAVDRMYRDHPFTEQEDNYDEAFYVTDLYGENKGLTQS